MTLMYGPASLYARNVRVLIAQYLDELAGTLRDQLGSFALAWATLAVMMLIMMRVCVQFDPRDNQWVIRD